MDLPGDGDESIAELLDEDPKGAFVALNLVFSNLDDEAGIEGVLYIAEMLAKGEGINLFRVMRTHPEHTRDVFGLDPDRIDDDLVAKIDALME